MDMSENDTARAEKRMQASRKAGFAVTARYDAHHWRVLVTLNTDVHTAFPAMLAQGLADACSDSLGAIEISPSGRGLHWPRLDVDLYVPSLLAGIFGTKQ